MGCCGCDKKRSALVASIFSIIQSGIAIAISSLLLNTFNDEKETISQVLHDKIDAINNVLGIGMIIQLVWLISSILLIYGNWKRKVCLIRTWLVVSAIGLLGQVLFPVILFAVINVESLDRGHVKQTIISRQFSSTRITSRTDYIPNLINKYITLVITYSGGGVVTVLINIILRFYTGRSAAEMLNSQPARHVFGSSTPRIMIPPQNQLPYTVGQLPYPTQQPQPYLQGQAVCPYPPPPPYQSQIYYPYSCSQPPSYQDPSLPNAPGPDYLPPPYPTSGTR